MALRGSVIIHHHGVQAQDNYLGFQDLQPPTEKLLQQGAEQPDTIPGESGKKPFDRMLGEHLFGSRLAAGGVSVILFQVIKVNQMPTGAIYQEV